MWKAQQTPPKKKLTKINLTIKSQNRVFIKMILIITSENIVSLHFRIKKKKSDGKNLILPPFLECNTLD